METYLTEMGIPFLDHEILKFRKIVQGSDTSKTKFYYEDYVQDWKEEVEKHKYNFLEKDYENFDMEKAQ